MRVAVYGGSGFIGSRICKALVTAGCAVLSVSRTGQPPEWASVEPWSSEVKWVAADVLSDGAALEQGIDAAVCCIGNMRPASSWDGFFGLHWDYERLVRENGLVTARACEGARRAGARRMVVLSVSSSKKWAYGGALQGYIDGKLEAEAAARAAFGDANIAVVGPSLVLGGGRFAGLLGPYAAICDSPAIRGQTRFFKAFKSGASSGWAPQDAVNEVALTPPASVEAVAHAACACLLGTVAAVRLDEFRQLTRAEDDIREVTKYKDAERGYDFAYVDGTDQINRVAKESGAPPMLAAAVAAAAASEPPGPSASVERITEGATSAIEGATGSVIQWGDGGDGSVTWQRMPLDTMPMSAATVQNDALSDALAADPRMWRTFTRAQLDAFEVPCTLSSADFVRAGQVLYKPSDTTTQSPSAHGEPFEGGLVGQNSGPLRTGTFYYLFSFTSGCDSAQEV